MTAQRDDRGRFVPGNPGGPGRPPARTEAEYLRGLNDAVGADDWLSIVHKAVTQAKKGSPAARGWLSKYLLGDVSLAALANEHAAPVIVTSPADAVQVLGRAVDMALTGGDLARAKALGDLAGAALRAFELVDLQEQVNALRAQLAEIQEGQRGNTQGTATAATESD